MQRHRRFRARRIAVAMLALLLSGAGGAAAQRIAPARFVRTEKAVHRAVAIRQPVQSRERHFSVLACVFWGVAGSAAAGFLGSHLLPVGGGEDPEIAGLLIGGTIGLSAGVSCYALTH